ncbi:MAG TPA: pyruvate kinase, partial [Rhodothermales bacterium]|nr:pyruvate kinase [Rhodothermales bacterium]
MTNTDNPFVEELVGRQDADQDALVQHLITKLEAILRYATDREEHFEHHLEVVHPPWQESARNLLHYLALRNFDIQEVQSHLASLGLSSLGRTEAHVMASLQAVLNVLYWLSGRIRAPSASCPVDYAKGRDLLAAHTEALFGVKPDGRNVRIMVTLPSEAATEYELVLNMVRAGMDCVRINCAHDSEEAWAQMIEHVRQAQRETGRPCRILMDLGGPKLRTGPLKPGPRVVHLKPHRNLRGRVVAPARLWLTPPGVPEPDGAVCDGTLPVDADWLAHAEMGDHIRFRDARGKKRTLKVVACQGEGRWAELHQSIYIETGTVFTLHKQGTRKKSRLTSSLGVLPPLEQSIILKQGDTLLLHRDLIPGRQAKRDEQGRIQAPARIACTMPQVFADVEVGAVVRFDDGKMKGVVRAV